jgi:predicted AAA+ superfamily ATPase
VEIELVKDYLSSYLKRKIHPLVKRELEIRPISNKAVAIIGPRRAGKTSLMWQIISNYDRTKTIYLDFEDIALRGLSAAEVLRIITEIFTEISGSEANAIFLDEVQNLTDWQSLIRTLLDRGYVVFVTGSTSKLLSREITTQLRGRSASFLLLPFSFREFLLAKKEDIASYSLSGIGKLKHLLLNYLEFGGYPEIVLGKSDKEKLLEEYKELIFLKDFVDREKIKSIDVARFIFSFVTQCFSSEMSARNVLKALEERKVPFGRNTVYDYVEKLQDTMIFFFLDKYSPEIRLRTSWPRKVYLVDMGLAWRLPYDRGRLIENAVFLELKRRQKLSPLSEIYYYRDRNDREVDFLIKNGENVTGLIQVTYASNKHDLREGEVKNLVAASKELRCNNLLVITWDYEAEEKVNGKKIKFVPLWKWLLNL